MVLTTIMYDDLNSYKTLQVREFVEDIRLSAYKQWSFIVIIIYLS